MSDLIEPVACDTIRARLPFPINDARQWMEVQISGLQDLHRPVPTSEETDDLPTVKVTVAAPYISSYGLREGGGDTEREFYPCSDGFCETGDAVTFPTIGIVVAHLILRGFGGDFLNLPEPALSRWRDLQRTTLRRATEVSESFDAWQQRPETERAAIGDARLAQEQAEAKAAHALLDAETRRLTGRSFDEVLASGRPFDPEELRYLDGAREYLDGSTD